MEEIPDSLITLEEAQEVAASKRHAAFKVRRPIMVVVGGSIVVTLTLLVLIVLSVGGVRTGLERHIPFLDQQQIKALEIPR